MSCDYKILDTIILLEPADESSLNIVLPMEVTVSNESQDYK